MFDNMNQWTEIRLGISSGKLSIREATKQYGPGGSKDFGTYGATWLLAEEGSREAEVGTVYSDHSRKSRSR